MTKCRKKIFNADLYGFFKKRLGEIREHYPQIEFIGQNRDKDHIHLQVSISPKISVGSVVRIIKSDTARDMKKSYPFFKKCYFGKVFGRTGILSVLSASTRQWYNAILNSKGAKIWGKLSLN